MSLIPAWSPFFQSQTRMHGRACQLDDNVVRTEPTNGEIVRAEVQDDETQTVTIHRDGRHAIAECTCTEFDEGAYCKHIWATLLDLQHAEEDGPGATAQEIARLKVRAPKARKRDESQPAVTNHSEPDWVGRLSLLRPPTFEDDDTVGDLLPAQRQVCYVVLPQMSVRHGGLIVELRQRSPIATGWSKLKPLKISRDMLSTMVDPTDRELCAMVLGARRIDPQLTGDFGVERGHACFYLPLGARRRLLGQMIDTNRCFIDYDEEAVTTAEPLRWDKTSPSQWELWMVATRTEDEILISVELRRDEQSLAIDKPQLILGGADGLVFHQGKVAAFDDREAFRWVTQFREDLRRHGEPKPIRVPLADADRFLDRLYMLPQLPEIELPPGIGRQEQHVRPVMHLDLFSAGSQQATRLLGASSKQQLAAELWFDYGGERVSPLQAGRFVTLGATPAPPVENENTQTDSEVAVEVAVETETQTEAEAETESRLIRRDHRAEREAFAQLAAAGLRPANNAPGDVMMLATKQMPFAVSHLIARNWVVAADERVVRRASAPNLSISSGIDWFELRGGVRFTRDDGQVEEISLPRILKAARSGASMITLGDGSQALLPEAWLQQHGMLTAMAQVEGDHLRFRSSQAALLDALLDAKELDHVDEKFAEARERLHEFEGIKPSNPPASFKGQLRPYQSEGLGWFDFLRWFAMGGVLADDMGLGKTIQVLAMLMQRHSGEGEQSDRPSLVVAPRSVVFNWIDEAEHFAPQLRVMAYAGTEREALRDEFDKHDIIVTSYGLMRRDIEELRQHTFDYIVLDEAQAIKNPSSQSAKAARLIEARHRLALTGTPVENHLGDLWSIFEFLNPGMLGANARFNDLLRTISTQNNAIREEAIQQIATSLRPFILRRTKKQVLKDLPEKTEQTIVCEMEPAQRKVYDDMRRYYRGHLLKQLDATPEGGSASATAGGQAFMVLEALLRLRQVACHPGLVDDKLIDEPSAKLDVLMENLEEVIDEGHKALVFSQFTSMLSLVRRRLEAKGIQHCYLDGQTRDRRGVVEEFQTDPKSQVFLISLKAGGFGLNLTAAEYVFILDPWWNPAVEQQAIDRTHRIGQTRRVFAYRMICQDTVEHRIVELQNRKRKLADAIIGGEENMMRSLTRDDLEQLLA